MGVSNIRPRDRNLMLIGIVFLFVLIATSVQAKGLIMEDDFSGDDDDPPNPAKWAVQVTGGPSDFVKIEDNSLRVIGFDRNWPRAYTRRPFSTNDVTVIVDWMGNSNTREPLHLATTTNTSGAYKWNSGVSYNTNRGWFLYSYIGTDIIYTDSGRPTMEFGTWYNINLTVRYNVINVTIREKDDGTLVWSVTEVSTNAFRSDNQVTLGCHGSDGMYDNFQLFDLNAPSGPIGIPPEWGQIPTMDAVEDIPITIDFSRYVSDRDSILDNLSITSSSSYVTHIDEFNVTFLFPNGVTSHAVQLILHDEWNDVPTTVEFRIQPVNDPPHLVITSPANHSVFVEGTSIEFAAVVTDPEITLGQKLTVQWISNLSGIIKTQTSDEAMEFRTASLPIGKHRITVMASDGQFQREAWLELRVIEDVSPPPTDDPPHFLTEPTNILLLILIILVLTNVALYVSRERKNAEGEVDERSSTDEDVTVDEEDEVG